MQPSPGRGGRAGGPAGLGLAGERIRKSERNALRKLRADLAGTDAHELLAS